MTEEKALTTRTPDLSVWQMIMSIAPVAKASRLFGVASDDQAAAIMLKGYELGLGLSAAFEFIHVIEGKPSISPKGMLALIHSSGQLASMNVVDEKDKEGNPLACTVTMKRANGFEYTASFSMSNAAQAGIIKPNGAWEKYPSNMLRWRAIGYCADVVFPDLCGGMLRPEELGANVSANGEPVYVEAEYVTQTVIQPSQPIAAESQPVPQETKQKTPSTLQDLLDEGWTAQQVMEACDNSIPSTEQQVLDTWYKLNAEDAVLTEQENADA